MRQSPFSNKATIGLAAVAGFLVVGGFDGLGGLFDGAHGDKGHDGAAEASTGEPRTVDAFLRARNLDQRVKLRSAVLEVLD